MHCLSLLWCGVLSCILLFQYWNERVRFDEGVSQLPFARSVRMGDWVLLSGQLGVKADQDGNFHLVPGGLEAEVKQAFQAMDQSLQGHGLTKKHLVKCTVMLQSMRSWSQFNALYLEWLDGHKPTRSAFGVSGLALDAAVELECLAHR
jgi:2-iminobutanoate/2-iminopropanoate deaminase